MPSFQIFSTVSPFLTAHVCSAQKYPVMRGNRISERRSNVKMYMHTLHTWHVYSTSKCMIFARIHDANTCMYDKSQRRHEKSLDLSAQYECEHVFACWLRKHDRKQQSVQIRWSSLHTLLRVCHWESTPVCGSRNADNMYVYCTARFCYAQFRTGLQGNRIA